MATETLLRSRALGRILALALSIQILPAQALRAQGEPVPAETSGAETFGEVIDVRVVNVDAVVVDEDGRRVPGLERGDFEVWVEGEPVAIDYFAEIRQGQLVTSGDSEPPGEVERRPLDILVFFDGLMGRPLDHRSLAEALSGQVDRLREGDRMAIVVYDGRRVREVSDWSSSPDDLRQALDRFRPAASSGAQERLETAAFDAAKQTRREYEEQSLGPEGQDAVAAFEDSPELQQRKKQLEARLDRVARAVAGAMQGYGGGSGKKILLLMSGGWPYNSVQYFRQPQWGDPPDNSRALESLVRMADAANHLGFVLYPADVPEQRLAGYQEYQVHAALDYLAEETGGLALKNRAALSVLPRALEDSESYYWLGFVAPAGVEDARQEFRLQTVQPGLEVRSRNHLVDRTRTGTVTAQVAAAMLLAESAEDETLAIELGEPRRYGLRLRVPVALTLPLAEILLVPDAEGYQANLELRISAIDENGFLSRIPTIPWRFTGPAPQPGQTVSYETTLELRRLGHTVIVAVFDRNSGVLLKGERSFRR